MKKVSVVVPAYNEASRIASTLQAIQSNVPCDEIIVVDDGSTDDTAAISKKLSTTVIRLSKNQGKGAALMRGWEASSGNIILTLDGDLQESASRATHLLTPVLQGECDMAIAILPSPTQKAGFGLAKGLAQKGLKLLTGLHFAAPLSGQRAFKREVLHTVGKLDRGFGVEVALTVGAIRAGHHIMEIPVAFSHRQTGNDLQGFMHRGKEFLAISRALGSKWREGRRER